MMKDGVNSASRYYLNHVRDAYRQAAIDLVTGHPLHEEVLMSVEDSAKFAKTLEAEVEEDQAEQAEHVKELIEDCKKLLIPDLDAVVGAWGLIDNDPVSGKYVCISDQVT